MRIKTRLKLNSLVSLGMIGLVMFSFGWSLWIASKAGQDAALISRMQQVSFERTVLRDEYLLYREHRAIRQWETKSKEFRGLLKEALERFAEPSDQALLKEVRKVEDGSASLFSRLLEMQAKRGATGDISLFSEGEKRLLGQMLVKSYTMAHGIDRLEESVQKASTAGYQRSVLLMVILMFVAAIITVFNSAVINRNLAKRLAELLKGFEIMGAGNLNHHLGVKGDDELSALANTGNEMAAKLRESHTSIGNLNREIAERRQAEEKLKVAYSRLERMSSSNVVGVVLADAHGGLLEVNDYYLDILGFTRDEFEAGRIRWDERTPPEYLPVDWRAIEELRDRGICTPYEKEVHPEGWFPGLGADCRRTSTRTGRTDFCPGY